MIPLTSRFEKSYVFPPGWPLTCAAFWARLPRRPTAGGKPLTGWQVAPAGTPATGAALIEGHLLIWNKKYTFLFLSRADLAEAAFLQVKKNSLRHYMQKIKFLSILVRHGRNRPGTFALPRLCLRNLGLLKHDEYHISLFVRKIFPLNFKSSMLFEKKSVYKITSHDLK